MERIFLICHNLTLKEGASCCCESGCGGKSGHGASLLPLSLHVTKGTVGARKVAGQEEHIILVRCVQQHPFFHIMAASGTGSFLRSICSILLTFSSLNKS